MRFFASVSASLTFVAIFLFSTTTTADESSNAENLFSADSLLADSSTNSLPGGNSNLFLDDDDLQGLNDDSTILSDLDPSNLDLIASGSECGGGSGIGNGNVHKLRARQNGKTSCASPADATEPQKPPPASLLFGSPASIFDLEGALNLLAGRCPLPMFPLNLCCLIPYDLRVFAPGIPRVFNSFGSCYLSTYKLDLLFVATAAPFFFCHDKMNELMSIPHDNRSFCYEPMSYQI